MSLTPKRAELLIRSVTDYAIFMLDTEGHVASWNTGAERLKGYTPEEIIGQHFSCFYLPEDRAAGLPETVLATALGEGSFQAQGWRLRKDGSRFWANIVVEPTFDANEVHDGFVKITRDFNEQRRTEEALRKSEERFRLLVKGVTDYAIYMLDPKGRVSSWNAGAERFKGYTEDEILGAHFSRFYPPEDREAGVPQRALATAAEEGRFEAEGWRLRKDGERFWAHVVIDPIYNDDGLLLGYTKITRDLTERKRAAEALEQSQEQLHQAQKMEAIGQLTGGVAHDFNNLLSAVIGSLRIAQKRLKKGEDVDIFLDNAIEAAERGATLTQRLLAFARKQELKLAPTDIVASLSDMIELLQHTIGSNLTIRTEFPAALAPVMTDPTQLELAVMNLVVNARDAMPEGGEITLRVDMVDMPESEERFVRLAIEDQGQGMDKATLDRAFEPFFTTKERGKGTGLGLPMVKGMVEQSGGRLFLHSQPGEGTTAEILLPVAARAVAPVPVTENAAKAEETALRILVVDDEAIILLNTAMILSDLGHEVLEAYSGPEAVEILKQEKVDLLITDFAMPKMTGAELIDHARALQPDLKVLVVSGYVDLPEGATLQAHRLTKPFSDFDLIKAIKTLQE
ncbi:PAS domain S-box protein [Sulfitobacter aestuarii]|uniref:histidine kinase n=1 Tax=Sulfitobacter aestuarii TaxID=2161676 RepID=A0ABW5U6V6_9RHOB